MKKANLCKNPRKIGEISRHQWGVVVDRGGGELQHSNIFTVEVSGVNDKAMEKKIICLGNYYGQKQGCTGSVYCSRGVYPTVCSIDYKDGKLLILRKWKRQSRS